MSASVAQGAAQDETLRRATRTRMEWEPWEDQKVRDRLGDSVDAITVLALELQRTYESTRRRRFELEGSTRVREPQPALRQLPLCPKCFTELPALGGECGWCG